MTGVGTGGIAVETAVAFIGSFYQWRHYCMPWQQLQLWTKSLLVTINGSNNVNINICGFGASTASSVSNHNSDKQQWTGGDGNQQ